MSVETVYVDLDDGPLLLADQAAYLKPHLPAHMKVRVHGSALAVDVQEPRDAEEEVTTALDVAGLHAYVYEPRASESAANDLR